MSTVPKIKALAKESQEKIAENLHKHSRFGGKFPFDVENHLADLGYFIQPGNGWVETCQVDTCLIETKKLIRIQQHVYDNNYERARMSLAHELGHILLHREYIDYVRDLLLRAKKTDEYYGILRTLEQPDSTYAEQQAFYTAGAILAPREALKQRIIEYIHATCREGDRLDDDATKSLYQEIGKAFGITAGAAFKRISHSGLSWIVEAPRQPDY
ncbi:ImmA/IrrE family metallo-endopeptidase [Bdellovibrionota bacterium FG-1]